MPRRIGKSHLERLQYIYIYDIQIYNKFPQLLVMFVPGCRSSLHCGFYLVLALQQSSMSGSGLTCLAR